MREGRKYGEGTVWQMRSGKWQFQRSWTVKVRGRTQRIRRSVSGATEEEAIALGALLRPDLPPRRSRGRRPNKEWVELHRSDQVTARERRLRASQYIYHVLTVARVEGWPDFLIAQAIQAQLTPARVRRDIFGPCVYCGTWQATHVDHVVPVARGGTDDPSNLVSACWSCNSSKGDSDVSEWRSRRHMTDEVSGSAVA